jgi:hypothetical protein
MTWMESQEPADTNLWPVTFFLMRKQPAKDPAEPPSRAHRYTDDVPPS